MRIHRSKKMKKISLVMTAFAAAALVFGVAAQPSNAANPYRIKKGDTLWGISGGILKDHFQWPLIWKENAQIKNPDRIYPGERIKIPSLTPSATEGSAASGTATSKNVPIRKPAPIVRKGPKKPAVKIITPVRESYLFNRKEVISSGFMSKKVPSVGEVRSSVGERALIAKGDDVYIDLSAPAAAGAKFLVAGVSKIDDPLTGKFAGYLIEPHAIAVVTGENAGLVRAAITDTFERVGPGDVLIKYAEPRELLWDTRREPSVEGHVLALEKQRLLGGGMDIIYLNKGSAEGLKAGDMLQTKTGPDTNAIIQVVTVRPDFATAMIRKSRSAVNPGDLFTGLE